MTNLGIKFEYLIMARFSSNSMELGRIACVYQPFSRSGVWKLGFSDAIDSREREGEMEGEEEEAIGILYRNLFSAGSGTSSSNEPRRRTLLLTGTLEACNRHVSISCGRKHR